MYSPKITEELIPQLYHIKKETRTTMTKVVDSMIREGIRRWKQQKERNENHENNTVNGPTSSEGCPGI
jgi:predicted lipoprotein